MLTVFFHCCCWRTRTVGCKLEVQGKWAMLCLNIIFKWNITWHNVIKKQTWLSSHLYTMLAGMGPWRNSTLQYVYAQLNIFLQFKGAFVVNENQELRNFCWWFSSVFFPLLNYNIQCCVTYSSYRSVPGFVFTRKNTWLYHIGFCSEIL